MKVLVRMFVGIAVATAGTAWGAMFVDETKCFPVAPSQPTGANVTRLVNGQGGVYSVIAWRQSCPTDPGASVLLLRFSVSSGNPQVQAADVLVQQAGISYAPAKLSKDVNATTLDDFAQLGNITSAGVLVVQATAGFDANGRVTILFNDTMAGRVSMVLAASPAANPSASVDVFWNLSDMWWDESENGTGMSIVHHGTNQLFVVWYTYTDAGDPLWIVFPGGKWTNNTFSGQLFTTKGTGLARPWNPAALSVTAVGTGALIVNNSNSISFGYTVNGVSGAKTFTRQRF
jgi:hypothetical protein